jgi:hypothetical protein
MRAFRAAILVFILSCYASSQTYTINTFAGGGLPVNIAGTAASIRCPSSVAVDSAGNVFFTVGNSGVLRLDAITSVVTLAAGNGTPGYSGDGGPATSAQLHSPNGLAVDSAGNLYIADTGNVPIRKVSSGVITTVAGNGTVGFSGDGGSAVNAEFYSPAGIALDSLGNLYIADTYNNCIRKLSNGVITTVAGSGPSNGYQGSYGGDNGPATSALMYSPSAVAVDSSFNLYIADSSNNRVRLAFSDGNLYGHAE